MSKTVKVLPNQSLHDVIISEYGSLEAGMAVAAANGVDITHVPIPGNFISMPALDTTKMNLTNAEYIRRNNVVIGTLALPDLILSTVLKPMMSVQPTESGDPHALGYYAFVLKNTDDFVNAHPLLPSYFSDNTVFYETEERYLAGLLPESSPSSSVTPMPDMLIPYHLTWTVGLGYMLVWSDLSAPVKTATFRDNQDNEAFYAPLTILDNVDMAVVIERLIGDIAIEVISTSPGAMALRLIRFHPPISLADFADHTMEWLGVAAGGTPDPADPGNPDKTIIIIPAGNYTIGVKTLYYFPGGGPAYPPSAFTMVISAS